MPTNRLKRHGHFDDDSAVRRDGVYDDRHCPHVHCHPSARRDAPFPVTIHVDGVCSPSGKEKHHISSVALYDGTQLLGEANFPTGNRDGGMPGAKVAVTFNVMPTGRRMKLRALAYCTEHGLWEGPTQDVAVED